MSDPGTTYRTREEIQDVRTKNDAIEGLKKYILEWGISDEAKLKVSVWIDQHRENDHME
jgi:pyruvate dehydrogenase E1 component alpha subunit